jgi:thymidylate synthase (FAD)
MKVDLIDSMGTDLTVVNAARVSFDKTSSTLDNKDIKLIKYLAKHNHWSPFSHCFLQFRVKAPIFIARQLAKHQVGLSWNEVSRRYVDSPPEFYEPETWRGKPENVKQGSDGEAKSQYFPNLYLGDVTELALNNYDKMIVQGVAPEMARMVLPQNMYTEWYWSGSLYAFSRVCQLRLDKTSQAEVQQVAIKLSAHCWELFPHSWDALIKEINHEQTNT